MYWLLLLVITQSKKFVNLSIDHEIGYSRTLEYKHAWVTLTVHYDLGSRVTSDLKQE